MARTIVSVQYRKKDSEEYGGRPYSYYTELPLKTGDLVVAPTKWGASPAKVAEVDIPWSRIGEQIEQYLQTITEYQIPKSAEVSDI